MDAFEEEMLGFFKTLDLFEDELVDAFLLLRIFFITFIAFMGFMGLVFSTWALEGEPKAVVFLAGDFCTDFGDAGVNLIFFMALVKTFMGEGVAGLPGGVPTKALARRNLGVGESSMVDAWEDGERAMTIRDKSPT